MLSTDDNKILSCLGLLILSISISVIGMALHGWAVMKLWAWFVVPFFHLQPLTLAYAIGLGLLIGLFVNEYPIDNDNKSKIDRFAESFVRSIMPPLVAVFFGWIISAFI